MAHRSELDRIRSEYARRAADRRLAGRYGPFNQANLFAIQTRERALLKLLRAQGVGSLVGLRVLDLGCGYGGELRRLLCYGAASSHVHGLDLLLERLQDAHRLTPGLNLLQGNAGDLPYADAAFDIILHFTLFSSILDQALRQRVAGETLRVLKPGGLVVWYDLWLNPTNPATRGIRPPEIRSLFPGCSFSFQRVTLAPPIARRVVPVSWLAAYLLERLPFLRTHYLVGIKKPGGPDAR